MKNFLTLTIFAVIFSTKICAAEIAKPEFQLARLDGTKFVSNKDFLGKKTILFFFDIDCPPCIKKLNQLKEKEADFNQVNLAVINLVDQKFIRKSILNLGLNPAMELLQAPSNPRTFLRKFGNNSGQLPFLILLNDQGKICQSSIELFTEKDLQNCI